MSALWGRGRAVRRAVAVALMAAAAAASSGEARADRGAARRSFEEGAEAYRKARYADAARAYERAAEEGAHAAPYLNAADAWELDGNNVRAARACDRGLALSPSPAIRRELEKRAARLERTVATLEIASQRAITVRVDDGESVDVPVTLRLSPGRHSVAFGDGTAAAQAIEIAAGETRRIVWSEAAPTSPARPAPLAVRNEESPAARAQGSAGPPGAAWIAFAVGATALVATGTLSALTLDAKQRFERDPTEGRRDDFYAMRTSSNVAGAITLAAVATGVVLWIALPKATSEGSARLLDLSRPVTF